MQLFERHHFATLQLILAGCLIIGAVGNLFNQYHPAIWGFMVVASIAITIGQRPITQLFQRISAIQLRWLIIAGLTLMLLGQLAVLTWVPVTVYHDPIRVLLRAEQMSNGDYHVTSNYFWRYPNNVPVTYLLSLWFRLTNGLHLTTLTGVHLLSLLTLDGFVGLTLTTIRQLTKRPSIILGALGFFVLTPFAYTYFLQAYYTDLPAMVILLCLFRILYRWPSKSRSQKWWAGFWLVGLGLLGEALRANMIVMVPATLLTVLIAARHHRHLIKPFILPLAALLIGMALSVPFVAIAQHQSHFKPNDRYEFPVTSWIAMGLQPDRFGSYNARFVRHQAQLPNKAARAENDQRVINQTLHALGPIGWIKLVVIKIGALLHVDSIQDWYNGGLREAPPLSRPTLTFWQTFGALLFQLATISLLLATSQKLFKTAFAPAEPHYFVSLLAILTVLGYLAFHSLLWEVSGRYGQVLTPLLLLLNAAAPDSLARLTPHPQKSAIWLSTTALACVIGASLWTSATSRQPQIVAAQRSQLSAQYGAHPQLMVPHAQLHQTIKFNHAVSGIVIQAPPHAALLANIMGPNGVNRPLRLKGPNLMAPAMPAGRYTVNILNPTNHPQGIDLVKSHDYRFAHFPVIINHIAHPNWSLIYTADHR